VREPERTRRAIAERIDDELQVLRRQSQFREVEVPAGVNLCSNDYLGLASDAGLKEAVLRAVTDTPTVGSTGSRLLSGNRKEWEELEAEFARFAGTEAALYFGSGYGANVGLLGAILRPGDIVFSDALNHASLIDGMRLSGARRVIYPHRDLRFLEKSLREHAGDTGARVIVTESVFSMEGDVAGINDLVGLADIYDAELVVDEAHATGTCGPEGRGIVAGCECERKILAIVHTCGKALASAGAFVCGTNLLRQFLINRARTFIFSTATPPYFVGQIRAALALAREAEAKREHIRKIAMELREGLSVAGLSSGSSTTHIVPVFLGSNDAALHVAAQLQANGFAAKAIRPPTVPPGTARVRLSLTCEISFEEIHRLISVLHEANILPAQLPAASPVHA
jgi:8-amino-7-oxononanoate synthase